MAPRPASVTQAEVTRAVKAVAAAGVPVGRVEVDPRTGRVVVHAASPAASDGPNPWDEVLR